MCSGTKCTCGGQCGMGKAVPNGGCGCCDRCGLAPVRTPLGCGCCDRCGLGKAKSMFKSEPIIVELPIIIKAMIEKGGHRTIEFEASATTKDYEGDVIEQKALLDSKDYFLSNGFIDVDHYCELGRNPQYAWLGIKDPDSWIVGKPTDVMDLGNYRTGVKAEIKSNSTFDPITCKADWLWQQLHNEQGQWKASVFGYPGPDTQEGGCTIGTDGHVCASRYLVKSFRWHSTALTRNPINKSLKYPVQILTAKAFAAKMGHIDLKPIARSEKIYTREALRKSFFGHMAVDCPETCRGKELTTYTIRGHFIKCEDMPFYLADVYSLAMSELIKRI